MTPVVPDYEEAFAAAIHDFWMIKTNQQAAADLAGTSDGGTSGSVRAGKHMSPFEALIRRVVLDAEWTRTRRRATRCISPASTAKRSRGT